MNSYGKIDYMNWVKTDKDLANPDYIDMANSSFLPGYKSLYDLAINPEEIPIGGPNPYGYKPLIETIAKRYSVKDDYVFLSQGTSLANYLLFVTLFERGDTILIEDPAYQCLHSPARAVGLNVLPFPLHEDNEWRINVDEVAEYVSITGAKGILLSNPHNPTGIYVPDTIIEELADAIGEKVWFIVDEVYREWGKDLGGTTTGQKRPNLISTTSLTKVWGLGGLRAGWCVAPPEIVQRAQLAYDHMGVVFPFPTEWIIHQVMKDNHALEAKRLAAIESISRSRKIVVDALKDFDTVYSTAEKVFTGYGVMKVDGKDGDTLHEELKEKAGVLVTPGSYFNMHDYVRLSWCRGENTAKSGSEKLVEFLR